MAAVAAGLFICSVGWKYFEMRSRLGSLGKHSKARVVSSTEEVSLHSSCKEFSKTGLSKEILSLNGVIDET